jgi:hypothetical protein
MVKWRVWILVFAGAGGAAASWGTGAGLPPVFFPSHADCERVRRAADGAGNPQCVYTTVLLPR